MLATENGKFEIIKYLIEYKVDINEKNKNDWNALIISADKGNLQVMKYLIKKNQIFMRKAKNIIQH